MSDFDPANGNIDVEDVSSGQPLPGQGLYQEELISAMGALDLDEDLEKEPPGCSDYFKKFPPSDDFELEESFPEDIPWSSSCGSRSLLKSAIRSGTSLDKVPPDSRVYFKYVAFTETNNKVPYDTLHKLSHKTVVLGQGSLILGLEAALKTMSVGEVAHFRIAPDLGYGLVGCPQIGVPGGTTLVFTIHMLQFIPSSVLATIFCMTKSELREMDFSDLIAAVNVHVGEVKKFYFNHEYERAHKIAKKASDILDFRWTKDDNEHKRKDRHMAWLLLHQGICSVELEDFHRAKKELRYGLRVETNPYKKEMYYQLAIASVELAEFQWARKNLKNFEGLCSGGRQDRERLAGLVEKINASQSEDKHRERGLMKRMFGWN